MGVLYAVHQRNSRICRREQIFSECQSTTDSPPPVLWVSLVLMKWARTHRRLAALTSHQMEDQQRKETLEEGGPAAPSFRPCANKHSTNVQTDTPRPRSRRLITHKAYFLALVNKCSSGWNYRHACGIKLTASVASCRGQIWQIDCFRVLPIVLHCKTIYVSGRCDLVFYEHLVFLCVISVHIYQTLSRL